MSKKSIGGMKEKLLFYKQEDLIYNSFDSKVESFKQGAIPLILECVSNTVSYEVVPGEIDGEVFFTPTINAVVSDINPTNVKNIAKIHRYDCVCLAESKTEKHFMLGSPFTPIKLEVTPKISENHSFNGFSIVVTSKDVDLYSLI